jgi:hypothetical protein
LRIAEVRNHPFAKEMPITGVSRQLFRHTKSPASPLPREPKGAVGGGMTVDKLSFGSFN